MECLTKEYNRRFMQGDRDGLKLAWIEKAVDDAPTVEAVPVKWLEERYPIYDTYGTEAYFRKAYAIHEVIKEWHERRD